MNTLETTADWNVAKGQLKQKWATLTDNDLEYNEGKRDVLYGRIQKRTGQTMAVIEKAVKEASSYACGC